MNLHPILMGALGLALIMFFTWALEVHRTLREVLTELKRIRDELENRDHRDRY
ncbi:MAG: hypothetical protein VX015_03950 [Planctomycetota bacterium]|nr:hypothetical protein [Planctomycetota bacterium]MEC8511275.1 hypothetical protein [Planctomycetota bacterium]